MLNRLEISKKVEEYRETHKESEKLSDTQIISILSEQGVIKLTKEQELSLFNPEFSYKPYFSIDEVELTEKHLKRDEVKIKLSDGKTYNLNKTIENRLNLISQNLKKAEEANGFLGAAWSGFKNLTGIGDSSDKVREQLDREKKLLQRFNSQPDNRAKIFQELTGVEYNEENLEKFIKAEIKLKSEQALNGYKEGQDMAVDIGADIVSGIAAVGIYTASVAAAPFSGGTSIAVGVAAAGASAAAIKTSLKAADAVSGGRQYTLKDAGHDAATGAFSGVLAPVTGGLGGAVGKTAATKLGVQAVKQIGKEVAEETAKGGFKQAVKTALTNPTGYEYAGGNIAKRALASGAEMAADGAVGGAIDNAFRTAYDGGSAEEVLNSAVEGFVGGAIMSPIIGGGMKAAGKAGHKLGSGSGYIDNFAIKKVIENSPGYKNSDWVRTNIGKFIEDCQKPYYDFGTPVDRISDRLKHPDLSTHKMDVLTTFLSDSKLYDNPKVQEEFSNYFPYIHDAKSAENITDGFKFYLLHKEYHNNSNIKDNLTTILFNARLPIEKKAKIFNLVANDSNLDETKRPFLNHGNTKLEHFISCSDKVDIDLAYRILHDTNDNNGTILNRILQPGDECYSEITALYKKFIPSIMKF